MRLEWFTQNWALKLVSVLIAIIAWALTSSQQVVRDIVPVGLTARLQRDSDFVVVSELPRTVSVEVRGPRGRIQRMKREQYVSELDLRGATDGDQTVAVSLRGVTFPHGIEVVRLSPPVVEVQMDRQEERWVPVIASLTGEPENGFKVVSVTTEPETVRVRGPKSLLPSLERVRTADVSIAHRTQSFTETARVLTEDARFQAVAPVIVRVTIEAEMSLRTIEDVAIEIRGPGAESFEVEPKRVALKIRGPKSELSDLAPTDLSVFVEANASVEGRQGSAVAPKAVVPKPLELLSFEPDRVLLKRKP